MTGTLSIRLNFLSFVYNGLLWLVALADGYLYELEFFINIFLCLFFLNIYQRFIVVRLTNIFLNLFK